MWGLLVLNVLTLLRIRPALSRRWWARPLPREPCRWRCFVALTLNRRLIVRPNVFLCLVSLLVIEAVLTSLQPQYFGTVYRTFRLAEFVAVLWLLTPWWGRRDLLLVRCHLRALCWSILGSVLLGLLVAPGIVPWRAEGSPVCSGGYRPRRSRTTRRLRSGWWSCSGSCGQVRGRAILLIVVAAVFILVLTHTRTALVGVVTGILVAGLSLIVAKARVRKFFVAAGGVVLDRDHDAVQRHHHLAGPGRGHAAADRAHRPDQGLGSPARLSTRQVPGDLRFRPVERVVQWPPHRQQLARLLPGRKGSSGWSSARRSCSSCS